MLSSPLQSLAMPAVKSVLVNESFYPSELGKSSWTVLFDIVFLIYNGCLLVSKTNVILDIYTQHFCVTASSGYVAEDPATIATFQSAAIF